MGSTVAKVL